MLVCSLSNLKIWINDLANWKGELGCHGPGGEVQRQSHWNDSINAQEFILGEKDRILKENSLMKCKIRSLESNVDNKFLKIMIC